ncbi:hypothetical protein, partial [Anaeromusa sp.]|uniref:hypothetical protein n=1 Tax=Anaeromusa sp. TaxID=1872520 RepID=UPI00261FC496
FEKIKSQIDFSSLIFRSMLGGKIKRPHYEACKFKGFEFVRTLKVSRGRATVTKSEQESRRRLLAFNSEGTTEAAAAVIVFETFIGARRSAGRKCWRRRMTVSPV